MASIRVVVVDDEPGYAELVGARLEDLDGVAVVATTADPQAALETVRQSAVDCVISDYDMPKVDGLELLDAIRDIKPNIPYILVTGVRDKDLLKRAREAGVTTCVRKDGGRSHYDRLVAAIRSAPVQSANAGGSTTSGRSSLER